MDNSQAQPWHLLHIDDDEEDYLIIRSMLKGAKTRRVILDRAATPEEAQQKLSTISYQAVLVDYDLGARTGIDLIREFVSQGCDIPMILLTGRGSYEVDVEAMNAGASLYLTKKEINPLLLERSIRYAIERKQTETKLRLSEAKFSIVFQHSPTPIFLISLPDGRFVDGNQAYLDLIGFEKEEVMGKTSLELGVTRDRQVKAEIQTALAEKGSIRGIETTIHTKTGQVRMILSKLDVIEIEGEKFILGNVEDITERRQAEVEREQLLTEHRRQKELLERLIQNAPVGIAALHGPEHRFILANPAQHHLFPTIPEFIGHTVKEIWSEYPDTFTDILDRVYQTGEPYYAVDAPWQTDRGQGMEESFYTFSYSPLYASNGTIEGILVLSVETTQQVKIRQQIEKELAERIRIEQALRESQERFHLVLDNSPIVIYTADRELRYTWVYHPLEGGPAEDILGKRDDEIRPIEDMRHLMAFKRFVLENGETARQEICVPLFGLPKYYDITAVPIKNEAGEVTGLTVIGMDVTERVLSSEESRQAATRIEVQQHLLDQREQERQQMARDLHDGPLQDLIGLTFELEKIQSVLLDTEQANQIREFRSTLQKQIAELRAFATELRPPILAQFGLEKAIHAHLHSFQEKHPGLQVSFKAQQDHAIRSEEVCLALFRIYQEGLNNIVKHAQASQVKITLTNNSQFTQLEIQDNGSGFIVPKDWLELARHGHLGLVGIQERAEAIGAQVQIQSAPGKGTMLRIILPLTEVNPSIV